jgi:hypothetical protein
MARIIREHKLNLRAGLDGLKAVLREDAHDLYRIGDDEGHDRFGGRRPVALV